MMRADPDVLDMDADELCARIASLTGSMMRFWKTAHGWAPIEAAGLLNKSMLEWQTSLAASLSRWLASSSDGDLILAWSNLGALVEGQLKLFLSIWYNDYLEDAHAIRRDGKIQDPDGCTIEPLRQFFVKRIWSTHIDWDGYIKLVQSRRNAIHAFRTRDIGTFDDWRSELRSHLGFLRDMNDMLPYPDEMYKPGEL